jgi:hypothetical protein
MRLYARVVQCSLASMRSGRCFEKGSSYPLSSSLFINHFAMPWMESPRFYKNGSYTVIGGRSSTVVFQRGSGELLSKKDCVKRWRSIGSSNFKLFARFCSGFLWRRYDRQSTKWEGGRIFLACLFDHEEARNVRNVCQIHLSESSQIAIQQLDIGAE